MDNIELLIDLIKESLSEDLLKNEYKKKNRNNRMYGHCYVASEALYHLLPENSNYKPSILKIDNITHWFLEDSTNGNIIDITSSQFNFKLDYSKSKHTAFLSKKPSKRCLKLLNKIYEKINC